jgi:hypothetical protein
MPRACSICTHPDRLAIETALGSGTPLRTIAARWSVSKTALLRHRERHGSPQAQAAQAAPPVAPLAAAPHTLTTCAAALLAHCLPEVRERFEDAAPRLEWPLDLLVVTALDEYVRHLDQCPRSTAGPER